MHKIEFVFHDEETGETEWSKQIDEMKGLEH